jgi:hypothetical protein
MKQSEIVDQLVILNGGNKFEVYKYYEDRADNLKARLWSSGTWLLTIMGAMVAVPFTANYIEVAAGLIPINVVEGIPVIAFCIGGFLMCFYSWIVIHEFKRHIEGLWAGADHLINLDPETVNPVFKGHGFAFLRTSVILFALAWGVILIKAIILLVQMS